DGGSGVTINVYNIAFVVHDGAELDLSNLTLAGSKAASVQTDPNSTTVMNNVSFKDNDATSGAAINNTGDMTITGGTFSGNDATADGGAIFNIGNLVLNGVTFTDNDAGARGGAIANGGTLTINASPVTTFDNNHSSTQEETEGGGALFLDGDSQS